ncbi:hypothetical protein QUA54_18650 [Microcoleus sp. MOSTC5]|uniref:hypothetical protein n=1 Tax=Microcoleus sp. MOSTC5 TaxID=3055378 RepID=UPI002FD6A575
MLNHTQLYPSIPVEQANKLKTISITNSDKGHKDGAAIVIPSFIPGTEARAIFAEKPHSVFVGGYRCRFFQTPQEAWQEACYEAGLDLGLSLAVSSDPAIFHNPQILETAKQLFDSMKWWVYHFSS